MSHRVIGATLGSILLLAQPLGANVPGGGTGAGPNVTLADNGSTVTLANGLVSILCDKVANITQINYTYNNGGGTQTVNLLAGGHNGGQLYWETSGWGGTPVYSVVSNTTGYAEIEMLRDSPSNGVWDVHFSMLKGSPGFYVTPIWIHRSQDTAMGMGETRDNIYAGSIFNWMSVDAARNRLMNMSGSAVGAFNAPVEVSLWTNGIYAGQYEDKYAYSADLGVQRVWGWSSVGSGGRNVGLWNVSASGEYYNGGPMKRELMEHMGTTILNMLNGGHYGGGTDDASWAPGEIWAKVYGPYFIYCNCVTNTITGTNQAAQALYEDAKAQAAAEQTAWPYSWFNNANYASAAHRGTVTGRLVINDSANPNASAAALWVGVIRQPASPGVYDFQQWMKPYQFWVKTDTNGNFTIPNVIATNNYTLYAFGPGAAGTYQSLAQTGGDGPNTEDIPASPFSVTVTGGGTNNLGAVTWTPAHAGQTVFEIGYPNRTGDKFRHGDDYWVSDVGPVPGAPSPVWGKHIEYPFDFPNGPSYTVGQSRWATDWNYVQPVVMDNAGTFHGSTSLISFNLPAAPTNGAAAAFYIALSSDYQGPMIVQVNGNNIAASTGYFPNYSGSASGSDTTTRHGIHGIYSDIRLPFSSGLLHAGQNTISLNMRKGGAGSWMNHAMYDYLRLEVSGYVPPAPASVTAYAGNNRNLVSWPVTPGATSYTVLRSATPDSGYVPLTNGVVGPVCGSGPSHATYVDKTAANGATYYYAVQSVNPVGSSSSSAHSSGTTPSSSLFASIPAAPTGLMASINNSAVTLHWNAVPGANVYTVQRGTVVELTTGYVPFYTTLTSTNTSTTYSDASGTLGSTYSYFVTATRAGGTSVASAAVTAKPVPPAPAAPPANLSVSNAVTATEQSNFIAWSPVSGAVGYILYRSTSPAGPFAFPNNYVMSVTTTNYTDDALPLGPTHYYKVVAMNAGGVAGNLGTPPAAPADLTATAGGNQVALSWRTSSGATGYNIKRATVSGGPYTTIASPATTNFTDLTTLNGTVYFFVVSAVNTGSESVDSAEVSATPYATINGGRNLTWRGDGSSNTWNVGGTANWRTNGVVSTVFTNGDNATFDDSGTNTPAIIKVGLISPGYVLFGATKDYSLGGGGSLAGTMALEKLGSNRLILNGTNTYSGGTTIDAGVVQLGAGELSNVGIGAGPITFFGGTLQLNGYGITDNGSTYYGVLTNNLVVPVGETGTVLCPQRIAGSGLTGTLTGGGTLTVVVDYVRGLFGGNWSAFSGQINVTVRSSATGGQFRINNNFGFAGAALSLGPGVKAFNLDGNNHTIDIGELSGSGTLGADSKASTGPTWRIGARNTSSLFSGNIQDSGVTSLTRVGAGMLTLAGTGNTYSGPTTVSAGTLHITGALTTSNFITVSNGATLAVSVSGTVTANTVRISAGGVLTGCGTISGNLLNNGTVLVDCGAPLAISGTVTNNGAMRFSNGSGLTGAGRFVNNGLLDLMTGAQNVPANFINNGTVLVATNIVVSSCGKSDDTFTLAIQGYGGHTYQLQCSATLQAANWESVGPPQDGAGTVLTFTDTPSGNRKFYRILVSP